MIKLFTRLTCLTAFAACALAVGAVPAKPQPFAFVQPDGSVITVSLRGDERAHCYVSDDGCILINKDQALYYATLDEQGRLAATSMLAQDADKRSSAAKDLLATINQDELAQALVKQERLSTRGPRGNSNAQAQSPAKNEDEQQGKNYYGLFPGTHFPAHGEQHGLVILVEYQDVSFTTRDANDYFTRMLNDEGFSQNGGTGSARDYFIDSSNGIFTPVFDVYGPVTLSHNREYYGGNNSWGDDQHPEQMVIEACQQLDDEVDFSIYDGDGDGKIDMVFIFYAGRGEASGGGSDTVWPHSWDITSAGGGVQIFDGVQADHYACSNELQSGNTPDGIGTFVHEFSHVLGLPDLYATSYTGAFHPASYSVLSSGNYNNSSHTPPTYSIFERTALGWMEPQLLTEAGDYTLEDIKDTNTGFCLATGKDTEYFLFENRQKKGWDAYIPGHGMIVWHIDYNEGIWNSNIVNNSSTHQYVDMEEADNIKNEATRDGDPFPGASNVVRITDRTSPNLRTWDNEKTSFPITQIVESNGLISFYGGTRPGYKPTPPQNLVISEVKYTSFRVTWLKSLDAEYYQIRVTTADGQPVSGWEVRELGDVSTVLVSNIEPSTTYHVNVYSLFDESISDPSETAVATTLDAPINYYTVAALDATEITANSFVANWEGLDLAQEYIVKVSETTRVDNPEYTIDFTGGINSMPEGWSSSSIFEFLNPEKCGAAVPALRFVSNGNLTSCAYENEITDIAFWCMGVTTNENNTIQVQVSGDGYYWTTVATVNPINETGTTTTVSDIPEGMYQMRLNYVESEHRGSVSVDDVVVKTNGYIYIDVPLEGYSNYSAGTALEAKIEGLKPTTEYRYTVDATDGALWAKTSKVITLTTSNDAGIGSVEADANDIEVNGRTIYSTGACAYTVDGRLVGQGTAITLTPGIYIVRSGSGAVAKVIIK